MLKKLRRASVLLFTKRRALNPKTLNPKTLKTQNPKAENTAYTQYFLHFSSHVNVAIRANHRVCA
jgi:hypothetical protein